ncbi:MAG: DNA alkylation repair protein [Muribaculaceae bacterium]|nr:DNA alkylation repair protein [Muribaculaceae bacterium]
MEETPRYNPMQTVKRRFFAMRNGIIADVYRKAGSPYRIIFGLNLPQIVEIAQETAPSRELAEALWANTTTRESLLLAPMLMPLDEFSADDARRWAASAPDFEAADILCHRLLRHLPDAAALAGEFAAADDAMTRYVGVRLAFNILYSQSSAAIAAARTAIAKAENDAAARVARQVLDEADACGYSL